jgi:hypothetical protein
MLAYYKTFLVDLVIAKIEPLARAKSEVDLHPNIKSTLFKLACQGATI